jgi:hypothetical protein
MGSTEHINSIDYDDSIPQVVIDQTDDGVGYLFEFCHKGWGRILNY